MRLPQAHGADAIWSFWQATREIYRIFAADSAISAQLFFGDTHVEIREKLSMLRDELDREVYLALLAAIEGELKLDMVERDARRHKRGPTRLLRAMLRRFKRPKDVSVREILDQWKAFASERGIRVGQLGSLKQSYDRRDWLAHGRYWDDHSYPRPRPEELRELIQEIRQRLDDFPLVFDEAL